jgi:transcription elongation GreA/GreB family factor
VCLARRIKTHRNRLARDAKKKSFNFIELPHEADPSRGTVSYVSPPARAVLTRGPGDPVEIAGWEAVKLDMR